MLENIQLSFQSIFAHKMRSILTMLGVIIGIAAIIAIFSLINGNTEKMKQEMVGGSNNAIDVEYGEKSQFTGKQTTSESKKPAFIPLLSEKEVSTFTKEDKIKNASVFTETNGKIYHKNEFVAGSIRGINPQYFAITPYRLLTGRMLTENDGLHQKQVCLIDKKVQEKLFQDEDPLGEYLEINGHPFKIVGVTESTAPATKQFSQEGVFIPYDCWYLLSGKLNCEAKVKVQTYKADDLQASANQVANYLNQSLPTSDYIYGIIDLSKFAEDIATLDKSNFSLLVGVASISLLVGGIGVMNIMLVSVTERTKEIGVKKALGARRKTILWQFLVESVTLTMMGGVLGILTGLGIALFFTNFMEIPFVISPISILGSLLFSSMIGILFGLLPAVKASKLDPIEALRYE